MPGPVRQVVARFPAYELVIERLARNSEHFRDMCEEYAAGVEALERWERAAAPKPEIAELRESLAGLEQEIFDLLQEVAKLGRRSGAGKS
jgi:hypothetical protein